MKKLLLLLLIIPNLIFAQTQTTHLSMLVMRSVSNGVDISKNAQEQTQFLTLYSYLEDETKMYMANVWVDSKTQSHGEIYNIESKTIPSLTDDSKVIFMKFDWDFKNSYNDVTGTAVVTLQIFIEKDRDFFEMEIISKKGKLEYGGILYFGSFEDYSE